MRADIHHGPEQKLHQQAGYISAKWLGTRALLQPMEGLIDYANDSFRAGA
jgi:hypothetical protein